ncbi:glycoside hydrolase family protein [Rhizoctonia solani AG-3 Rhs1AP]|uniref:Glycoside hydrolase family protein n=2 Tax=Rhizoctonia solani AG-3 TaxID=1086053 RepID=A0A074SZF2_9AGAM|nr:glycoside hydrolase family protein [Rhizoctonia solani AG-3 Rhs1AP]KEP55182.1 glycoside hydrolase family protein [Rhizoctonia solani 123E]
MYSPLGLLAVIACVTRAAPVADIPVSLLTDAQINLVRTRLIESAQASWELGTSTQALLEHDYSPLSVYGSLALAIPNPVNASLSPGSVYSVTDRIVQTRNPLLAEGFVADSAVGDPPSLGVAMLLANFSGGTGGDYNAAIQQQLDYLLTKAPRNSDGAISHRIEQVQLWSDNVFMVPPFLAYYGALHNNASMMTEAFNQIQTYRNNLKVDKFTGLWRHIQLGEGVDVGHWTTGNGWAAAGMMRVLTTMATSSLGASYPNEQALLARWISGILTSAWAYQLPNGTLYNYADLSSPVSVTPSYTASPSSAFSDASGTALLAATTYRLATHLARYSVRSLLDPAALARQGVAASVDPNTGWLQNVANPYSYSQRGTVSPEGQAFVLMLEAAAKDWESVVKTTDRNALESLLGA